jgi:hypothetical protein
MVRRPQEEEFYEGNHPRQFPKIWRCRNHSMTSSMPPLTTATIT